MQPRASVNPLAQVVDWYQSAMSKAETVGAHKRASHTVHRPYPKNFDSRDAGMFDISAEFVMPHASVKRLHNVEFFGRGPLRTATDGNYLSESFVSIPEADKWRRRRGHWRAALERPVQRRSRLESPAICITDNWSCGYFHWTCDALSRLQFASEACDLSKLTLLLPHKFRRYKFIAESLKPFGLGNVRLLRRFERVTCDELVFPTHLSPSGNPDAKMMSGLRDRFTRYLRSKSVTEDVLGDAASKFGDRVYLSRRLAGRRRITNESDVLAVLRDHGFKEFTAEDHSWETQVAVAMNTRLMVSNHGGGLASLFMMRPGSRVLELRDSIGPTPNCFYNLADAADIDFYYQLCPRTDTKKTAHWGDIVVGTEKLDRLLNEMTTAVAREPVTRVA